MALSLHPPSICNKVTNDTFQSVVEDQIIWQSVFGISVATVYKGPLILLSPLWQMPPWHRMSYATVILSGIISLCTLILCPQLSTIISWSWCYHLLLHLSYAHYLMHFIWWKKNKTKHCIFLETWLICHQLCFKIIPRMVLCSGAGGIESELDPCAIYFLKCPHFI